SLPEIDPTSLDLLHPEPLPRATRDELTQSLSFAFASGVSGGLFGQALEQAPLAPSTWDPKSFAHDLFLEEFIARCFRVRVGGHEAMVNRGFLLRVLSRPPSDPRVTDFRRGLLLELSESASYRSQFEQLYVALCRLRSG